MTSPNETDVHNELSQAFSGARSGDELSMRPVFLEDSALHIFPCRADKRPTTPPRLPRRSFECAKHCTAVVALSRPVGGCCNWRSQRHRCDRC